MKQITLYIDNPKIEAILSDISLQDNKTIDNIISDLIEKYIYLYSVRDFDKETGKKEDADFMELLNTNKKILQKDNLLEQFEDLNKYNKNHYFEISDNIDIAKLANEVNDVIL